jgi:hypothetical protein
MMIHMRLTVPNPKATPAAPTEGRPERATLLEIMLDKTARGGVPIRRAFLQTAKPNAAGSRAAALSALVRTRDVAALDTYLLIHAMASSSDPYRTWFPSATWAQIAGLDEFAGEEAAKARWSKIVTKLVRLGLVRRERSGNKMNYWLLHESGSGVEYQRPTKLSHGSWFSVPHFYWLEGHDRDLNLPEKAMLLIALDQPDDARLPYEQMDAWYGLSKSTAERGITGLLKRDIITMTSESRIEPKSKTGWTEVRRYTTLGPWSIESRHAGMTKADRPRKPRFEEADLTGADAAP